MYWFTFLIILNSNQILIQQQYPDLESCMSHDKTEYWIGGGANTYQSCERENLTFDQVMKKWNLN